MNNIIFNPATKYSCLGEDRDWSYLFALDYLLII